MKKIFFYIILFGILGYGVFLRFYELGAGSFWIDEGYSSLISYGMLQHHFLPELGKGIYDFSQYFFHFFQTLSFFLFSPSDFSARLPSFIFSIFHIIIFYFFSKTLLKNNEYKNIGILFLMGLFLFSTWQIIWSREARFYEVLSCLYLAVTFFLYQYKNTKKEIYLTAFFILLFLGLLFHHFFFAFVILAFFLFLGEYFEKKEFKNILILLGILGGYGIIKIGIKYFSGIDVSIGEVFPKVNFMEEYDFFTFIVFYFQTLLEQLGILFYLFFIGLVYFIVTKKWWQLLLFGGLVFINIFTISFGYFAHSRYIFHLFSLITLLGGYMIIVFFEIGLKNLSQKNRKIFLGLGVSILTLALFGTYNMTFFPQNFYYIDYTSPKPNFKNTYEYIEQNYPSTKIISGFPHMCYWYNRENTDICEYALRINLIGNTAFDEKVKQKEAENYTNVPYIDDFSQIDTSKYLFVFDDLTLKNAINKELVTEVITQCQMIYKDVGNYDSANFIGIWKCQ